MQGITPNISPTRPILEDNRPVSEIATLSQLFQFFIDNNFTDEEVKTFVNCYRDRDQQANFPTDINPRLGIIPSPHTRLGFYTAFIFAGDSSITVNHLLRFINHPPHNIPEHRFHAFLAANQEAPQAANPLIPNTPVIPPTRPILEDNRPIYEIAQHMQLYNFLNGNNFTCQEVETFLNTYRVWQANDPISTDHHVRLLHLTAFMVEGGTEITVSRFLNFISQPPHNITENQFLQFLGAQQEPQAANPLIPNTPATPPTRPLLEDNRGILSFATVHQLLRFFTLHNFAPEALRTFINRFMGADRQVPIPTPQQIDPSLRLAYYAGFMSAGNTITVSHFLNFISQPPHNLNANHFNAFLTNPQAANFLIPNTPATPPARSTLLGNGLINAITFRGQLIAFLHHHNFTYDEIANFVYAYRERPANSPNYQDPDARLVQVIDFMLQEETSITVSRFLRFINNAHNITEHQFVQFLAGNYEAPAAPQEAPQAANTQIVIPTRERLMELLNDVNPRTMVEFFSNNQVTPAQLVRFYSVFGMQDDIVDYQVLQNPPYIQHNLAISSLLLTRQTTPQQIFNCFHSELGIAPDALLNFLENPEGDDVETLSTESSSQAENQLPTEQEFNELLQNVDSYQFHQSIDGNDGLANALFNFYQECGMSDDDIEGYYVTTPHEEFVYTHHDLIMTYLLDNNLATVEEIFSVFAEFGISIDTVLGYLQTSENSPVASNASQSIRQPLTRERLATLLGLGNSRRLFEFFQQYYLLQIGLENFYTNDAHLTQDALATYRRSTERSPETISYMPNDVVISYLLQNNLVTLAQILGVLSDYGLTEENFVNFLENPDAHQPQRPATNPPGLTRTQCLTALTNVTVAQLNQFLTLHSITNPFRILLLARVQDLQQSGINMVVADENENAFLQYLTIYDGTLPNLIAFLRQYGVPEDTFIQFLTNPTVFQTPPRAPTNQRSAQQQTSPQSNQPRTNTQQSRTAPTTTSQQTTGLTLPRCVELLRNVTVPNFNRFLRNHGIDTAYSAFIAGQMEQVNARGEFPPMTGPYDFGFYAYLTRLHGTLPQLLTFLRRNGISEHTFVHFLDVCSRQRPTPAPNQPNTPQPAPSNSQPAPAKPLVRRSIESISSKELNSLFSADIKKASAASLWKHRLWKTAAITTLVAYSALTLAALLITGFFAPFLVLPIVALASIGLLFPTLKLYNSLQPKITASKKIADEEQNIAQELAKLSKLSDAEFSKKYSHLFNLDKIQHPEIETLIAEKGINLYRPIIARLNHYNNKAEQLQKTEEQLEKTYAMKKNKEDLTAGRNFLNEKHKLHLEIADTKVHAAFIQALLQEPSTLKNKKLTDLCTLNKLDYLNSNLPEDFSKSSPNPRDVFKIPFHFATFKDPKTKNLGLSQVLKSNVGQLADHILGY